MAYREVSRVLDARPRVFSLPVSIILPAMFTTGIGVAIPFMLGLPLYMVLLTAFSINAAYFFLFGQEWWRLMKKFRRPKKWIRTNVKAIPFTLNPPR